MNSFFRRPVVVFFVSVLFFAGIFFLVPLNLFDGEYTFVENGVSRVVQTKMSLSYFIGIGASKEDLEGVAGFRLLPMGYFLAFLLIFALPLLIAYRVHLANQQDNH